jgi:hypothetical protein
MQTDARLAKLLPSHRLLLSHSIQKEQYSYIHHSRFAHWNKLPSCECEVLVGSCDNEKQTALKWDRSSHPFAPPCRIFHTFSLKWSENHWQFLLSAKVIIAEAIQCHFFHESHILHLCNIPLFVHLNHVSRYSHYFEERENSLPCPQEPDTDIHSQVVKCCPRPYISLRFILILSSTFMSSYKALSFRFSHQIAMHSYSLLYMLQVPPISSSFTWSF